MRGSALGLLAAPSTPETLADQGSSGEQGKGRFLTGPFPSGCLRVDYEGTEDWREQASSCCCGRAEEAGWRL